MNSSTTKTDSKCITTEKWDPTANDYSQPRPNKLQGKNIYISNTQIRSNLVLQTPLMRTWGISMYVDDSGEAKGGYSMSLVFDKDGFETEESATFKKKIQQFEDEIVAKAYENRMAWFGDDDLSMDTIRVGFYSMLKYPRLKDAKGNHTKKKDMSKSPSFKIRVNNYDDKWQCHVYDTNLQPLFTPDEKDSSPIDFVPKGSMVITKIKCDGIWTGSGTAWGVKWNLQVCVVQPIERTNPYSVTDMDVTKFVTLSKTAVVSETEAAILEAQAAEYERENGGGRDGAKNRVKESSTYVENSDNEEEEEEKAEETVSQPKVEAVMAAVAVAATTTTTEKKRVVKKVVK